MDYELTAETGGFTLQGYDVGFSLEHILLAQSHYSQGPVPTTIETVYNIRRNTVDLRYEVNCVEMDLTDLTRVVVTFEDSDVVADTAIDPGLVVWDEPSTLSFSLGGLGFVHGTLKAATIITYSPARSGGMIFSAMQDREVVFLFLDE